MPMIQLTLPTGVLPAETLAELRKSLPRTLLNWEGAPDTPFFRAHAWARIEEVADDGFGALEDDLPRFRIDVTVPEGALSDRRKAGLVAELTDMMCAAAGLDESGAARVWVLVHEQPEGTWGVAGHVVKFAELTALARQQRSNA